MLTLELTGPDATERLGAALAAVLHPPSLVTLVGDLGTGKTTLVRCVLRARGVTEVVASPSFMLAQSYRDAQGVPLHHLDLYRLAPGSDADLFAWDDYLSEDAITFVEWPEAGNSNLPRADIAVTLEHRAPTARAALIRASRGVESVLHRRLGGVVDADPKEPASGVRYGGRRPEETV